jgi:hypothetical protein
MSSSRRGGTKCQNCVITAVALSSNENHSSNGLGEVIRACCYCDICVKIWRLLLPFTKNRLSTESSPLDPPSTRIDVPVGTCVRTVEMEMQCEQKEDQVEHKAIRHLQLSHIVVGL